MAQVKSQDDSKLLQSWADGGGVQEPDAQKIDIGWQSGERPPFQWVNWLFNKMTNKLNHILQNGIPLWNNETTYTAGNHVLHGGVFYKALSENTNSEPPSADWKQYGTEFKNNIAASDPTATDDESDGYEVFSKWVNTSTTEIFICIDATEGAAVWELTTLTADDLGSAAFSSISEVREIPQNSQSANYTAVLSDAGGHLLHPSTDANNRTFTIPANASVSYPIGTAITFVNDSANNLSIAITSDTLVWAGSGSTGSRTLSQYGVATALKIGATRWYISGTGLS